MPVHTIRLRGPWTCQPVTSAAAGPLPAEGTLTMPGDWSALLGVEFRGTVRLSRTFNRPTGLELGQHVWLVVEQVHEQGQVVLNGLPLGNIEESPEPPAGRYDITGLLQPRNELVVELACSTASSEPGRLGLVRLEIAGG